MPGVLALKDVLLQASTNGGKAVGKHLLSAQSVAGAELRKLRELRELRCALAPSLPRILQLRDAKLTSATHQEGWVYPSASS